MLLVAAVFAVGMAFGAALKGGPEGAGKQTCERTLRLLTVTVTAP